MKRQDWLNLNRVSSNGLKQHRDGKEKMPQKGLLRKKEETRAVEGSTSERIDVWKEQTKGRNAW